MAPGTSFDMEEEFAGLDFHSLRRKSPGRTVKRRFGAWPNMAELDRQ
jgi:hypothetical protein